jgi:hypothetical protein
MSKPQPSTIPTIAFAFAVGVHHSGEAEIMVDRELPPQYIPTISNLRNGDSITTPIVPVMQGCRKFIKFTIILSTRIVPAMHGA